MPFFYVRDASSFTPRSFRIVFDLEDVVSHLNSTIRPIPPVNNNACICCVRRFGNIIGQSHVFWIVPSAGIAFYE